jgi:hypothetical protein
VIKNIMENGAGKQVRRMEVRRLTMNRRSDR